MRAMKYGANDYLRKQELTRKRLLNSVRDVAGKSIEATQQPEAAARQAGHTLGARLQVPGIRILRLIGEGGMSRVYLASRESSDEPLVVKALRLEVTREDERAGALPRGIQTDRAHQQPPRRAHLRARRVGRPRLPGNGIL